MEKQPLLNTYVNNVSMDETIAYIEQLVQEKKRSYVVAINVDVVMKIEEDKYLKEITGNGAYYQVAWQKLADGYIALYGTTPIQINVAPILNDIFEDEEG